MSNLKQLTFSFFAEREPGSDTWVAYCLETGLVATSTSDFTDVQAKIHKLLIRQVEFALKNNNVAGLYHPAPSDVFERYFAAKSAARVQMQQTIDFGPQHVHPGVIVSTNAYAATN